MVELILEKETNGMKEVQGMRVVGHVTLIGKQIVIEVDEETFRTVLKTGYVANHEKFDDLPEGQEEQLYIDDGSICLIWKKKKETQPSRDEMIRSNEEGFHQSDLER